MTKPITKFRGQYFFLSNFFPAVVHHEGFTYATAEHAYQASKFIHPYERALIQNQPTAALAKQVATNLKFTRPGWDEVRLSIMDEVLQAKFQAEYLKNMLLATGDAELIEGNTWGDIFWGKVDGEGDNHLGRLLMGLRTFYSEDCEA